MKFNETKSQERLINLMLQAGVEWPEGAKFAAQDRSGFVYGYDEKPRRKWSGWWPDCVINGGMGRHNVLPNWHQTIITREQYQARDGWITWHGGECPLNKDVLVDVIYDGIEDCGYADEFDWMDGYIIAYRIHKPAAAEPCESVKACIPDQPTIEQLIAEYIRCKAEAQHVQSMAASTALQADMAADAVRKSLADAGWQQ